MYGIILKNSVQKKCNNCLLLIKFIMSQQIKDLIAEKSRFITNEIILMGTTILTEIYNRSPLQELEFRTTSRILYNSPRILQEF